MVGYWATNKAEKYDTAWCPWRERKRIHFSAGTKSDREVELSSSCAQESEDDNFPLIIFHTWSINSLLVQLDSNFLPLKTMTARSSDDKLHRHMKSNRTEQNRIFAAIEAEAAKALPIVTNFKDNGNEFCRNDAIQSAYLAHRRSRERRQVVKWWWIVEIMNWNQNRNWTQIIKLE